MTVHQSLAEWSSWVWPFLANHLWQSTLLSIAAFASAALLKNAPSRAVYDLADRVYGSLLCLRRFLFTSQAGSVLVSPLC